MESTQKIDYSTIEVPFDKTDVDRLARGPMLVEGWYRFLVNGARADISKNSGSMMFSLDASVVDGENNTVGKSLRHFVVIPRETPRTLLTAAGFPETYTHRAPNTGGLVRQYLGATRPTEFPHELTFSRDERQWYYKGVPITGEEAKAIKAENSEKLLAFVSKAWVRPAETFVGDTFVGRVYYQEGRDLPSIGSIQTTVPDGETLVAV